MRGIWNYTFLNWNESRVDHYIATLYERFEWLAERPEVGKHRTDVQEGYYCFPHRSHVVFYLIRENAIDIIGVPHKYMDIDGFFSFAEPHKNSTPGKL